MVVESSRICLLIIKYYPTLLKKEKKYLREISQFFKNTEEDHSAFLVIVYDRI